MGNKVKRIKHKISSVFSVPIEIIDDVPRMVIESNTRVYIENFKGIIAYSTDGIMINAGRYAITLTGENLEIKSMTSEDITVEGIINTVDFS